MSESKTNKSANFQSQDEAFEYLVKESQNKSIKDQWRKELDQLPDAPPVKKGTSRMFFIRRASAAAAVFLVLLGSFFWYSNQNDSLQQIAGVMINETNFVLGSASVTRGVDLQQADGLNAELQKEIEIALEKESYDVAAGLFQTKEKKSQLTIDDKFYYSLSLARVENGDYNKAIQLLDDVISQEAKFYNEGLWLQALLYLKIDEPEKSKLILNKLINISNYQFKNIKILLKEMSD